MTTIGKRLDRRFPHTTRGVRPGRRGRWGRRAGRALFQPGVRYPVGLRSDAPGVPGLQPRAWPAAALGPDVLRARLADAGPAGTSMSTCASRAGPRCATGRRSPPTSTGPRAPRTVAPSPGTQGGCPCLDRAGQRCRAVRHVHDHARHQPGDGYHARHVGGTGAGRRTSGASRGSSSAPGILRVPAASGSTCSGCSSRWCTSCSRSPTTPTPPHRARVYAEPRGEPSGVAGRSTARASRPRDTPPRTARMVASPFVHRRTHMSQSPDRMCGTRSSPAPEVTGSRTTRSTPIRRLRLDRSRSVGYP